MMQLINKLSEYVFGYVFKAGTFTSPALIWFNQIVNGSKSAAAPQQVKSKVEVAVNTVSKMQLTLEQEALLEAANQAAHVAKQAVLAAEAAGATAQALVMKALSEKVDVVKSNSTARVDEINQLIREANVASEQALADRKQAEKALLAANEANSALEAVDPNGTLAGPATQVVKEAVDVFNVSLVPGTITTELSVKSAPLSWEVLTDFVQNTLNYFKDLLGNVLTSKPGQFITGLLDSVSAMIDAMSDMLKVAFDKIVSSGGSVEVFVKDIIDITIDAIGSGIKAVMGDVLMQTIAAIPKAIFDNIFNVIVNPVAGAMKIATDVLTKFVAGAAQVFSDVSAITINKIIEKLAVFGEVGKDLIADMTSMAKTMIDDAIQSFFAFVQKGFTGLLTDPMTFVQDVVKELSNTLGDIVKVVMEAFKVPGDAIEAVGNVIQDIIFSIQGGDKVVEKWNDTVEMKQLQSNEVPALTKLLDSATTKAEALSAQKSVDELVGMKLMSVHGEGNVDLAHVVSEEAVPVMEQVAADAVSALAVVSPVLLQQDDLAGLIGLAA